MKIEEICAHTKMQIKLLEKVFSRGKTKNDKSRERFLISMQLLKI